MMHWGEYLRMQLNTYVSSNFTRVCYARCVRGSISAQFFTVIDFAC